MTLASRAFEAWYLATGRRAWGVGYAEHKLRSIREALADPALLDTFRSRRPLPAGYGRGLDERIVEYPWALSRLGQGGPLLDAGSTFNLAEVLDAPALRGRVVHVVTLAPEAECHWRRGVSYLYADLRDLPLRDALYPEVACLSTLEHVGFDNALYGAPGAGGGDWTAALRELRRVLRPGGRLLLSVPYGRATVSSWQRQFDAAGVRAIQATFEPSSAEVDVFAYGDGAWRVSSLDEAAAAEYHDVRAAGGPAPDGAAAARAVACLTLVR